MTRHSFNFLLLIIGLFLFDASAFAAETSAAIPLTAAQIHKNQVPVRIKLRNGEMKTISLFKARAPKYTKALKPHRMFFRLARHNGLAQTSMLPPMVDLGMNAVPVLDQGPWGTCATFATTAAINAYYPLKGKAMISQLCNLELGKTLNELPDSDGGWNGSMGEVILGQINHYGYLPLSYQEESGCGGLNSYPSHSAENNGSGMPVDVFTKNSIKKFTAHNWKALPAVYTPDDSPAGGSWHGNETLAAVRQTLASGYRVTFGVLVDTAAENIGIIGRHNGVEDVFVLTENVISDIIADHAAGHAMVITGYDDNACATYTDKETNTQKMQCGLLKLRNSWGTFAGDNGDFYMTYDYFKYLTNESIAIGVK